jgi:hypothetical protein
VTQPDSDDAAEGLDSEVWNHLESGWQMAYDDLAKHLAPEMLAFFRSLAGIVVGAKAHLRVDLSRAEFRDNLARLAPEVSPADHGALVRGLLQWYAAGKDPWLTHAVHLEIADEGIGRAVGALERFDRITSQLGSQPIPDRALPYLREVTSSFLFGFDAATIALTRATLEQVARTVLVRIGAATEAQLKREKPDLEGLLRRLRQASVLDTAWDAANRIRTRGNTALHDHLYEERIRMQTALDSIVDLNTVLRELVP